MRMRWLVVALAAAAVAGTAAAVANTGLTTRVEGWAGAEPMVMPLHGDRPCPVDAQFSDKNPLGMKPEVLAGWQRLVKTAADQNVTLCLNDGKRSEAQQRAEFDDYSRKYGVAVARQYVLPPEKSAHVQGTAADVQPQASAAWLERSNGKYGWCRRYDNEFWHFEYSASYSTSGCPAREPHA